MQRSRYSKKGEKSSCKFSQPRNAHHTSPYHRGDADMCILLTRVLRSRTAVWRSHTSYGQKQLASLLKRRKSHSGVSNPRKQETKGADVKKYLEDHVQKKPLVREEESSSEDLVDSRILAMKKMQRLRNKYGKFSYSVFPEELRVNLEDHKARENEKLLRTALLKVSKLFFKGRRSVPVRVCSESLGGVLCSPGIGTNLFVNNEQQTTGMYVLKEGVVYWVSTAHNFMSIPKSAMSLNSKRVNPIVAATNEIASRVVHIEYQQEELIAHAGSRVPSPMAYPCLEHMPTDAMGRSLRNSVDIMIGQVPMVAKRIAQQSLNLDSLWEVRRCSHCPAIDCDHENAEIMFRINEVLRPALFASGNEAYYSPVGDVKYDDYKNVRTLLPGRNVVTGIIERCMLCPELNEEQYSNTIFIRSTNGVSPRLGDSGSVWVTEGTSKAVAITVGKVHDPRDIGVEVWVALFLFPCLEALCKQYEQSFPDVKELKSINGNVLMT